MNIISLSDLKVLGDERGGLIVLEAFNNVPFNIKRVYYIYDTLKDVARGFHAHRKLEQLAVCISGSCKFIMDDGVNREETILNKPNQSIFIGKMMWHEMHDFSENCILLVVASDFYDESDYIRNYESFKYEVSNANI